MKIKILICTLLLGVTLAIPEGYFKQEYQFKKSSSTFKNNELQTKDDDEGFYHKQGDLEGQTVPKVNQHSAHHEYVHPGHTVSTYNNRDLTDEAERVFGQHNMGQSYGSNVGSTGSNSRYQGSSGYVGAAGHQGISGSQGSAGYAGSTGFQESTGYTGSSGVQRNTGYTGNLGQGSTGYSGNGNHMGSTGSEGIGGSRSYSYSNSYKSSTGTSGPKYETQSNLGQLTQNLQDNLSRQLQNAVTNMHQESSYSQFTSSDITNLEQELKSNLTRQLQEELSKQYGNQGKRGSHSYTITSGSYNPTANYDNQELTDLTKGLEDNLLKKLHNDIQHTESHSSSHYSSSSHSGTRGTNVHKPRDSAEIDDLNKPRQQSAYSNRNYASNAHDLTLQTDESSQTPQRLSYGTGYRTSNYGDDLVQVPERTSYPVRQTSNFNQQSNYDADLTQTPERYTSRPTMTGWATVDQPTRSRSHSYVASSATGSADTYRNAYRPNSYADIASGSSHNQKISLNPTVRITDLAQNVQNDLSKQLNDALKEHEDKYTSSSYMLTNTRPNFQGTLDDLKRELQINMTRAMQAELEKHYGVQEQLGSYSFTSGSTNVANYKTEDLENLKQQIEKNLIKHLQDSLNQQENRYISKSESYSSSRRDYSHHGPSHTTILTDENAPQYGSSYVHHTAPISHSQSRSYSSSYSTGSKGIRQPSSSPESQNELQNIRGELVTDLSRQLEQAVTQQQLSHSGAYSSSYNTQNKQAMMEDLTEELKQNLTRQINDALREQSQGNHGRYSSVSASVSGTYNPENYNSQQLQDFTQNLQDELVTKLKEEMKKQTSSYSQSQYSSSSTSGSGYRPTRYTSGVYNSGVRSSPTIEKGIGMHTSSTGDFIGEDCMQSDEAHPKLAIPEQSRKPATQKVIGQNIINIGQHIEDLNGLTQQTEDGFGKLQVGNQYNQPANDQQIIDLGQQVEDFDGLTQQTEDGFGKLQVGNQYNQPANEQQIIDLGQQVEDFDGLTQQTEDSFSNFEVGNYKNQPANAQHVIDLEQQDFDGLTQQTEDGFGKLEVGSQYNKPDMGQHIIDLEQKTEDSFGKLQVVNQYNKPWNGEQSVNIGHVEDLDGLTQQTEDNFGKLNIGNGQQTLDLGQVEEHDGLTQLTEDSFGKLELGSQKNNPENSQKILDLAQVEEEHDGLTQQTEDSFGKLEIGSQYNKPGNGQQFIDIGQVEDDYGLTQQTEDSFGNLQMGSQFNKPENGQQIIDIGQVEDHNDLAQQSDDGFGNLEIGSQYNKPNVGQHFGQKIIDFGGLPQQTEDFGQKIENVGQQTMDTVGSTKFSDDFIEHSDYLQHVNNASPNQNQEDYDDLGQQPIDDNFFLPEESTRAALSLNDAHRAYISRSQYANKPIDDLRHTETTKRPASHNSGYHYGISKQVSEDIEEADDIQQVLTQTAYINEEKSPASIYSSSSSVPSYNKADSSLQPQISSENTTENTEEQVGFWKKVGGKLSNTYNNAKQKAKNLAEKINLG